MGMGARAFRRRFDFHAGRRWGAAFALVCFFSTEAFAETQVYLLRGWFGKGKKAEAIGHLAWRATVSNIISDRAA